MPCDFVQRRALRTTFTDQISKESNQKWPHCGSRGHILGYARGDWMITGEQVDKDAYSTITYP